MNSSSRSGGGNNYNREEESLFNKVLPPSSPRNNNALALLNAPSTPSRFQEGLTRSNSDSSSNYYSADGNSSYSLDRIALGLNSPTSPTTPLNSRPNSYVNNYSSHVTSILPSAAFFNPKRSPSINNKSNIPVQRERDFRNNGPLVTRRVSEFDLPISPMIGSSSEDEEVMIIETIRGNDIKGKGKAINSNLSISIPPTSPSNYNNSSLGKASREPLLPFPITTTSVSMNRSSSYGEEPILNGMRSTVQKARESFKSSTSPTSIEGGDFGRKSDDAVKRLSRRGGVLLSDEIPSEIINRTISPTPFQSGTINQLRQPRLNALAQPRPVTVVLDEFGNPIRNHQLHSGANRFFLSGRLLSSKDNPIPFIISLAIAIFLPLLYFIFSSEFMWTHLGNGGKASLFIFAWLAAIMITNMVSFFLFPFPFPRFTC